MWKPSKKPLFIITVLILVLAGFLLACNRTDRKKIIITNFDEEFVDSLIPYKENFFRHYAMYNVYINGYVNDSIEVKKGLQANYPSIFLKDSIKIRLHSDYYGEKTSYLYFNPYKATEGRLEIRYSLD